MKIINIEKAILDILEEMSLSLALNGEQTTDKVFNALLPLEQEGVTMIGHFVLNDCMLAYPTCEMNVRFIRVVVMAVDVLKGGDPTLIDREVLADSNNLSDENKMRAATDADYERFKVKNPYQ